MNISDLVVQIISANCKSKLLYCWEVTKQWPVWLRSQQSHPQGKSWWWSVIVFAVGWSITSGLVIQPRHSPMGRRIILYGVIFPPIYLRFRFANPKQCTDTWPLARATVCRNMLCRERYIFLSWVCLSEIEDWEKSSKNVKTRENVNISRRSWKAYHMPSYWGWTWKRLHLRIAPKPNHSASWIFVSINMHIHAMVLKMLNTEYWMFL